MKILVGCPQANREHKKSLRQYAHTYHHPKTICVADAFMKIPFKNRMAIIAHEIGHLLAGYEGSEEDANAAANEEFGVNIIYKDSKFGKKLEIMDQEDAEFISFILDYLFGDGAIRFYKK